MEQDAKILTQGKNKRLLSYNHIQQVVLEDLVLYIAKGYCYLSSIENPWGR
jgi:hypothetical protein